MNYDFSWHAFEYHHYERSVDWFWGVGAVALVLVVIAFITGNVIFGIFVVVGTAALILKVLRKPEARVFGISRDGLHIDDTLFPHDTLESFWIELRDGNPRILVKSEKLFMPMLVLPLGDTDPEAAHEVFAHYLPEVQMHEPISEKIMERLGF